MSFEFSYRKMESSLVGTIERPVADITTLVEMIAVIVGIVASLATLGWDITHQGG